jgi:predicted TPR repeat methyltransferase
MQLTTHILDRKALRAGIERAEQRRQKHSPDTGSIAYLDGRLATVEVQRERLNRSYVNGAMAFEEYEPLKRELDTDIATIMAQRAAIVPLPTPTPTTVAFVETLIDDYADQIATADDTLKRFIIDHLDIAVVFIVKNGVKRIRVRSNALDLEDILLLA